MAVGERGEGGDPSEREVLASQPGRLLCWQRASQLGALSIARDTLTWTTASSLPADPGRLLGS